MKNLKEQVLSGFVWRFCERISAQLVSFIVSIVLARLLEPSYYGAIAIVNIFIAFANVFVTGSFGNSLIQKKNSDDTDFSSVFYFNIALGIFLYILIFISAPYISEFYQMDILCPVLRVMGIRLIVAGANSVQHAYVSKHLLFKRFFWSTFGGTLGSAVIGVILAYAGFGIWALAAQYMFNSIVDTIVLWFTVKWRPKKTFSFNRLAVLFSYGWKLLVSSLLETGYNEIRSLIIGKMYTSSDLAFYNKGKSFPNLIVTNVNSSIQSVLFPAMAQEQDEKSHIKSLTRRSIRISSYIMLPLMFGLGLVAEPLIKLLLTEKWMECVPYLQIACFSLAFIPIHTANLQAIKALGRSDIFLKLEIIKKVVGLSMLLLVVHHGPIVIAASGIFVTIISAVINAAPNRKLLNYGYIEQLKDLFHGIIPLTAMCISVYIVGWISINEFPLIILQILIGVIIYVLISCLTKNDSFEYIIDSIKTFNLKN